MAIFACGISREYAVSAAKMPTAAANESGRFTRRAATSRPAAARPKKMTYASGAIHATSRLTHASWCNRNIFAAAISISVIPATSAKNTATLTVAQFIDRIAPIVE